MDDRGESKIPWRDADPDRAPLRLPGAGDGARDAGRDARTLAAAPALEIDQLSVTTDAQRDWHRIVVSLRSSVDLFAELADDPADQDILIQHEIATKPYRDDNPIILRPFEDAAVYDPIVEVIAWPFEHPCRSRFSGGSFGVWYGADELLTSVHETVHHFRMDTLASAAAAREREIVQERRAHLVACTAALVDLRPHLEREPALRDPNDYSACQGLGARIHHAALPGVLTLSARRAQGVVVGVFREQALSNARAVCYLTYRLDVQTGRVRVERDPGQTWIELAP